MKNIYDYINILGNKEEKIKEVILKCKRDLNLTTDRTCKIYSSYISNYLSEKHIVNKIINTKNLNLGYEHEFVLVPIDSNNYYLVDLTYSQFNNEYFKEL